jgi:hypothetical protein
VWILPAIAIVTALISDFFLLLLFAVSRGFVMIMWASGVGMGVGRSSRQQGGVGVLPMPDAELDTTQIVESVCENPPAAGGL